MLREITRTLREFLLVASTMAYCTEAKYVEGSLKTDTVHMHETISFLSLD